MQGVTKLVTLNILRHEGLMPYFNLMISLQRVVGFLDLRQCRQERVELLFEFSFDQFHGANIVLFIKSAKIKC